MKTTQIEIYSVAIQNQSDIVKERENYTILNDLLGKYYQL